MLPTPSILVYDMFGLPRVQKQYTLLIKVELVEKKINESQTKTQKSLPEN